MWCTGNVVSDVLVDVRTSSVNTASTQRGFVSCQMSHPSLSDFGPTMVSTSFVIFSIHVNYIVS